MMNIKISKHGELLISRKGKYKKMRCPFKDSYCADTCALFNEPDDTCDCLQLCNENRIFYKELIDER